MTECSVCGDETDMPYTCNYCGRKHCTSHKLPEKHDCPNVAAANTLGPELRREHQPTESNSRSRTKTIAVVACILVLAVVAALLLV
ncbi:AN1-type zinc finger protein [Halosolutus gelatinilyticus]|uniref:AN1-type zinc finger protein n=1 Tax=Halosolutus gelatinilyticus TaxID=2931975 RepID=UPI001FF2EF07|nr:AN1-type zinc finger protein [Halosolutus gelatinilyticus]